MSSISASDDTVFALYHRTTFTIQIGDSAFIIVGSLMIQNTDNRDTGREGIVYIEICACTRMTFGLIMSRSETYICEATQNEELKGALSIFEKGVTVTISLDGADIDEVVYLYLKPSESREVAITP
ncbi:hypothetical protein BD769DRAFT_1773657 [Suillus cothurnatus]|nr:hypothetical protein BD769DRAFT_1773657 [Suillus cothurnatus]